MGRKSTHVIVWKGRGKGKRVGLLSPGQECEPFPLEILDALDFHRQLEEGKEKGRGRDGAKLTEGRGPGDSGPLVWRQPLGSRKDCLGTSCGHKRQAESGCQFSQMDIWPSPYQRNQEGEGPARGGRGFRGAT